MTERRKEDGNETRSWFRSDRMFQEGNKWYFLTREGTVEGPYDDRFEAARMLDAYVMVMNSSFSPNRKLSTEQGADTVDAPVQPVRPESGSRDDEVEEKSHFRPLSAALIT